MPRIRLPAAVAEAKGATVKNPQRYRGQFNPELPPLGPPPKRLNEAAVSEWRDIADQMPWLAKSDRVLVEAAARLSAKVAQSDDISISAVKELRLLMSALGGSPTSRSKVGVPDGEGDDDPAAEFLN